MQTDINKLAKLLATMPAVQSLFASQENKKHDQALEARRECLARYKAHGDELHNAQAKREAALKKLEAERAKLAPLERAFWEAQEAETQARSNWQGTCEELNRTHGEQYVNEARYLIDAVRLELESGLRVLESNRSAPNMFGVRQQNPEVLKIIPEVQAQLTRITEAHQAIEALAFSESLTAEEIKAQAKAILNATGQWPAKQPEAAAYTQAEAA